ncbi:unnamed protein product [Vitrella brassicaformis CCMP3155]|uniref:Protein kinase domain-containing protein n=2 Tax=Vitrella brassicaformis TaxID=1169539 RepID=A0A0G4ENH7_VITBC|nr:unnamed protein product [Vitrella brassicaformis CCMP3155]|eukprot:CEL98401.1 unnamed protein product [Vitrella brassicaformis CCMP3155]
MSGGVIRPNDPTVEDKILGQGGEGTVYRGVWRSPDGNISVAVKTFKANEELDEGSQFMEVLEEFLPMLPLCHPNIVRVHGVCKHDKYGLVIVTELCTGGSLASYLAKHGAPPPERRDRFMREICEGVQYLHDKKIIHGDLKPENILLTEGLVIKILDFGISRGAERKTTVTTVAGTFYYMPPEGIEPELGKLTTKADIWAVGGVAIELHGGRRPFEGFGPAQILHKVVNKKEIPDIPQSLLPHIKNAIKSCFIFKAANRPTATQFLDKLGLSRSMSSGQPTDTTEEPPTSPWEWLFGGKAKRQDALSLPAARGSLGNVSPAGHSSASRMSMASTMPGPPSTASPSQSPIEGKLGSTTSTTAPPTRYYVDPSSAGFSHGTYPSPYGMPLGPHGYPGGPYGYPAYPPVPGQYYAPGAGQYYAPGAAGVAPTVYGGPGGHTQAVLPAEHAKGGEADEPNSHIQVVLPGEDAEGGEADDDEGGRRTGGPAKGGKLSAEEKKDEKARLQRVVKDFAKDAVGGMEMTVIDLDGRKFRTLFQMDSYLQYFTFEPVKGEAVPEHMRKIEMKSVDSVYRDSKVMKKKPNFPFPEDAPHCVGFETRGGRVKLFFLIPEEDARDNFYTCFKVLRRQ